MNERLLSIPVRGSNQSTDTKFATLLVDDAITFIESGRVKKGVELLLKSLEFLPDMALDRQTDGAVKWVEKQGWKVQK